jgi:multiple sugar transport system substrate-binding protein
MMNDAYVDWLALAPEGKVPVRLGTADAPTSFIDAWGTLDAGVDTKAPLSDFYSAEILSGIVNGTASMARWGIPQGQGALVGATLGELPVPKALNDMVASGLSPADAAAQAQAAVEEIAASFE